jgi:hypothetical protein
MILSKTRNQRNMAAIDDTLYVTGNSIKVADMKRVLGEDIKLFKTDTDEIQATPFNVSIDKIRRIHNELGFKPVGCEDTSFGFGKLAAMVKHVIDACEENEGDLYNVIKSIAPKKTTVDYTSIVSFKNENYEALFECRMTCRLCPRSGKGMIDPFAIPIEYTVTQYINGEKTVLVENQQIENPAGLSIAEQPENRHLVHPRQFALNAYNHWKKHV